jgi:hypothetical protein
MFARYNYNNSPNVFVTFSSTINDETEFDNFLTEWLNLYHKKEDFNFIFDTREMTDINIKYAIKMSLFIKKLKKQDYHYLQKSLILVNNNKIKKLLDLVFVLQSPVAPVYIWNTDCINNDELIQKINELNENNIDDNIILIKPGKSLLLFL